jgi:hypothetical protein
MKFMKQWLIPGFPLFVLALTGLWAWGTPFSRIPAPVPVIQAQQQERLKQEQALTFTGTVIKDGEQFTLRDFSGFVYLLDDSAKAKPFEGKPVKVTGHFGIEAKIIEVENIEVIPT